MLAAFPTGGAEAAGVAADADALKRLSLAELMQIEVTSVSRKPESLTRAPAAITVLTGEDIRRSAADSIPEALRGVPGLEVAQSNASEWAISARGFNATLSNKLLVLIDGRNVYTPLFSGVFWDAQDVFLEDLDRIEVIRGPGGTLWGANAVNGVINIISKPAEETLGTLLTGGAGTNDYASVGARYGARSGENAYYRVYAKGTTDDGVDYPGSTWSDPREMAQAGFRLDHRVEAGGRNTLQGDFYGTDIARGSFDDIELGGGNLLGRLVRETGAEGELSAQVYFDRTDRKIPGTGPASVSFEESLDTFDIDVHHRFRPAPRHDVVWGFGYRRTDSDVTNRSVTFTPEDRVNHLYSAFLQDEISLVEDRLQLTLGSKLEYHRYGGTEAQPNVRLSWFPSERETVWAAVSRAVRTPSRVDRELLFVLPIPGLGPTPINAGSQSFGAEELVAYELGYRSQASERLTLSGALFFHDYHDLQSGEGVFPTVFDNGFRGESYGVEVDAAFQVNPRWRLSAGYSYLQIQVHPLSGHFDPANEAAAEGGSPHHRAFLRSSHQLGEEVEVDAFLRYVDSLPASGSPPIHIDAYLDLNLRVGWTPRPGLEFSIVGRNLLDRRHPEFGPGNISPAAEIERAVFGRVTWRF